MVFFLVVVGVLASRIPERIAVQVVTTMAWSGSEASTSSSIEKTKKLRYAKGSM